MQQERRSVDEKDEPLPSSTPPLMIWGWKRSSKKGHRQAECGTTRSIGDFRRLEYSVVSCSCLLAASLSYTMGCPTERDSNMINVISTGLDGPQKSHASNSTDCCWNGPRKRPPPLSDTQKRPPLNSAITYPPLAS